MTDEFDDLKAAMDAATPAPDPQRKDANLRLAEKNFDQFQGSRDPARLTSERGTQSRLGKGIGAMLNTLTSKAGLTATTAIVAVGLFMVIPQGRDLLLPPPGLDEVGGLSDRIVLRQDDTASSPQVREAPKTERSEDADASLASVPAPREQSEQEAVLSAPEPAPAAPLALNRAVTTQALEEGFADAPSSGIRTDGLARIAPPSPAGIVAPSDLSVLPEADTEAFANAESNPLKITTDDPVSTFSIDVDTASYAVVRSSLMSGRLPPPDAVRVEEMVNYFPYAYPAPDGALPFEPTISVVPTPWNAGTNLVHIAIQGELPAIEDRPALNLVFLIDTSGSMQDANKLPLLKQSLRLMLSQLRPEDEVSIVTYAGSAGQVLEPTRAAERSTVLAALDRLEAGGSTAGQDGLQQAYQVAEGMSREGEVTRVLLATDGDFNVGIHDPEQLKAFIAKKRDSGAYLSVLGFGRGNLDDATMQALAQNGNGQAAYIDTLGEAQKVLVDQLTGALFPIANDVKIQVEFNPAQIAEYRLIGYETRALRREDFANDRIDAGDIGAGHTVTAIYEITPVGSEAIRNAPLRYAETNGTVAVSDELGFFRLRYKEPGQAESQLIEAPILRQQGVASDDVRFSVAMAGFGQLLRGSDYLGNWGWDEAIVLANGAKGTDAFGYRAEAVKLLRLSETLSQD